MVDSKTEDKDKKFKKEVPTSVISISRDDTLGIDLANPLNVDQLYATIPEVSRAIDFRAGMICPNGYEVISADEKDKEANKFAWLALKTLENSGGVGFVEQLHKNTDAYGDGYVELVMNRLSEIVKLVHVHPYRFGYETEVIDDPDSPGSEITIIKVDKNSQEPIGYATFKLNAASGELEIDKKIALEKIAHLKFKVIGDNFYGISLLQPMLGSITRKVRLEDYADRAARLIAVPKLILKGDYDNDEEAKADAREAASLDVNDVVILQGEDASAQFITPGQTNIPELRNMFITNITTATGVPRPALTSESAEINKATMDELMKNVRTIVKSHQRKIRNLFEQVIFPRLGESYKIADFETKIPTILFLEDNDSVQETIAIVKSKAVALTSLSNTYQILKTAIEGTASAEGVVNKDSENGNVKAVKKTKTKTGTDPESDIQTKIIDEMEKLLLNTIQNFNISSDTNPLNVEDSDKSVENSLYSREVNNTKYAMNVKPALEFGLLSNAYTKFSITEKAETLDEYEILKDKLELAFSIFKNGKTVIDKKTDKVLELEDFSTYKKYLGEIELSIKENKLEL